MPKLTLVLALLLIVLGVGVYLGTQGQSKTALIPAAAGILFATCGVLGYRKPLRQHAMHAGATLAVLGFAGTTPGLLKLVQYLCGVPIERPTAAIAQTIMALLCLGYVLGAVRSFLNARKTRNVETRS